MLYRCKMLLFIYTIFRAPPKESSNSLPGREQAIKCCNSSIFRKLAPLSFVCCVSWIGVISYFVTWMITIIGFTIGVPDTVMGLSFLAVGTSIPEVFSSLIVCKQGKVQSCYFIFYFKYIMCLLLRKIACYPL